MFKFIVALVVHQFLASWQEVYVFRRLPLGTFKLAPRTWMFLSCCTRFYKGIRQIVPWHAYANMWWISSLTIPASQVQISAADAHLSSQPTCLDMMTLTAFLLRSTAAVLPDPTTSSYRITNDVSFDEGTRYNGDIGATPFIVNRKCLGKC